MAQNLLNTQQAAEVLGFKHTASVRKAIHRGRLQAEKIGRDWFVSLESIEEFKQNKKEAK